MTLIDLLILAIIGYYAFRGFQTGLIGGILGLLATTLAFYVALFSYNGLGSLVSAQFHTNANVSKLLSFLLLLIVLDVALSYLFGLFRSVLLKTIQNSFLAPLYLADKVLGILPSVLISAVFITTVLGILSFFLSSLPINNNFKNDIQNSWWNKTVSPVFYRLVPQAQKLLQGLPYQNLTNLLITNRPYLQVPGQSQVIQGRDLIRLKPPTQTTFRVNEGDEAKMLALVNKERKSRGLKELTTDKKMIEVARAHSLDMIKRAYFSHYDPEGKSPADRMDAGGAEYQLAGENLACAYSVEAAHDGLMKSPGHRENILRSEFGRVGIGVYDGGECGKMFTQTFAD